MNKIYAALNQPWPFVALALFAFAWLYWSAPSVNNGTQMTNWQVRSQQLSVEEAAGFQSLRGEVNQALSRVGENQAFVPGKIFEARQLALVVNYVGVSHQTRWLAVILLPENALEKAPPDDDEHRRLPNGAPIHVTYWKQPASAEHSAHVLAFPAEMGFIQVLP
jgi:hypothetical protein